MSSPQAARAAAHDAAVPRELYAMHLRALQWSYDRIAATVWPCTPDHKTDPDPACADCQPMYANRMGAKRAVDRALAREYEAGADTREELRKQQAAQIDAILQANMPRAMAEGPSQDAAAKTCLQALDRRAKLFGLDAPTRIQVSDELDAQVLQLVEQLEQEARLAAAQRVAEEQEAGGA